MNENEQTDNINEPADDAQPSHPQKRKSKISSKVPHEKKDQDMTDLKKKITEVEEKLKDHHDKYLRLSAEFDNYRKRTIREKSDLLKTAGEETLKSILPVMDDFERALLSADISKDNDAVKAGIQLIYNKFKDILAQQGLKEIEARSKVFDTDLHEAVTKIPAEEENLKGKVLEVIQKGYTLNDKVIRFAKVVVGE